MEGGREHGRSGIPLPAVAVIAAGCLAAGAAAGVWSIRRASPDVERESAGIAGAPQDLSVTGTDREPPRATPEEGRPPDAVARRTLEQAETEIRRLTTRIADLEARVPREKTREDRIELARQMIEAARKGKQDAANFKKLMALLSELDPVMGPVFLERYLDPEEKGDRRILFDLAMASGGQEVADWALKQLTDPMSEEETRRKILKTFAGGSNEIFSFAHFPVGGALSELAFQYSTDADAGRRAAAAGLLGAVNTTESRTALYQMAGSSDLHLRLTVIRSLGAVGDRETLTWLETTERGIESLHEYERNRLKVVLDSARERLRQRGIE